MRKLSDIWLIGGKLAKHLRPGPGWKHISGPVWDHVSGVRLHTGGMIRMSDGSIVSANQWPQSESVYRAVRITGSRRRGLMVWALWCLHHRMGGQLRERRR